jgi:hypothetical protein
MRTALAVLTVALLAAAVPAHAGTPFTVGEGTQPHLIVDAANGTAHVVWANDLTKRISYCRIPRRGTTCEARTDLEADIAGLGPDAPFLLRDGSLLRIVVPKYAADRVVMWTSADNGATWGPQQQVYGWANATDATEPILGPQPGSFTVASSNPVNAVLSAALNGSESATTDHAELPGAYGYDLQVAPTTDGGLVAVANDLMNTVYWRMTPGGEPSASASWTGPAAIAVGEDSRLAGGPGGTYVLYSAGTPGNPRAEVRRWDGSGWGTPVALAGEQPYINDIAVGPSGAVAAIWRHNDTPNRLRLGLSTNAGASFALTTIAREDGVMDDMDVAIANDNEGFAVFEGPASGATSPIRVASTDPLPEPSTTKQLKKSAAVPGGRLDFFVPAACVSASQPIRARLAFKRIRRKAGRVVVLNVRRVDFYVGTKRARRDGRKPFVQQLRISRPQPGRRYKLTARATLRLKGSTKRRTAAKRVTASVAVCP